MAVKNIQFFMQQVLKEQFLDIVEYTIQFISIFIIIRN